MDARKPCYIWIVWWLCEGNVQDILVRLAFDDRHVENCHWWDRKWLDWRLHLKISNSVQCSSVYKIPSLVDPFPNFVAIYFAKKSTPWMECAAKWRCTRWLKAFGPLLFYRKWLLSFRVSKLFAHNDPTGNGKLPSLFRWGKTFAQNEKCVNIVNKRWKNGWIFITFQKMAE